MSPWSVEVAGGYRFATRPIQAHTRMDFGSGYVPVKDSKYSPKVDLITEDITGVYRFNGQHAATLRFGFGSGTDAVLIDEDTRIRERVNVFSLMPGYRFTQPLYKEKLSVFGGVNAGITNESIKAHTYNERGGRHERPKVHASAYGFGYSAEVGLRYDFTEHIGAFIAYEFSGNTAQPKRPAFNPKSSGNPPPRKQDKQLYHGIRAGVSYRF